LQSTAECTHTVNWLTLDQVLGKRVVS